MSTYEQQDPFGISVLEKASKTFPGFAITISHLPVKVNDEVCEYQWFGTVYNVQMEVVFEVSHCDCLEEVLFELSRQMAYY
jgi:hypothetical protein